MQLTIGYLYGDLMNIYGDTGNIICLQKRCEWRGIEVKVQQISISNKIKKDEIDLYFFGGGQDQSQIDVAKDLAESGKGEAVRSDIGRGVPLLSICGGYQLLGEYYVPFDGPRLEGLGIFPAYTKASHQRMIGNIVIELTSELANKETLPFSNEKGQLTRKAIIPQKKEVLSSSLDSQLASSLLVGFENHSGKTFLKEGSTPLGKVVKGFGNNGEDGTEGCIYKNAIGCYMHGSLLPKNPDLADWLIKKALEVKYGKEIELDPVNDALESQAHNVAVQKYG